MWVKTGIYQSSTLKNKQKSWIWLPMTAIPQQFANAETLSIDLANRQRGRATTRSIDFHWVRFPSKADKEKPKDDDDEEKHVEAIVMWKWVGRKLTHRGIKDNQRSYFLVFNPASSIVMPEFNCLPSRFQSLKHLKNSIGLNNIWQNW